MPVYSKIKAVAVAAGLAVLATVAASVGDLGLDPIVASVVTAVIAAAAGYLKREQAV